MNISGDYENRRLLFDHDICGQNISANNLEVIDVSARHLDVSSIIIHEQI